MRRKRLILACALVTMTILLVGDVLAADRPAFCGTKAWQPIIHEASERFDVPRAWLTAVIQAESAGCTIVNGKPTISAAGAMGLMQLMPSTWLEYRARLQLGDDPFQAHENIFAGAAYLRDLYLRYGAEGFLAAYQAGPERYEEFLRDGRPLPRATLEYVARVQRAIEKMDTNAAMVPSPAAPAASPLFVVLSPARTNVDSTLKQQRNVRLFVPLSRKSLLAAESGK